MSNSRHWLEIAEYAFLAASVLGAVVAAVSGQVIYVALPVSVSLLLNLINRIRFEQQTRRRITAAMIRLEEELSEDILSLEEKVINLLSTRKQPSLPYSQAQETQLMASNQVQEAIADLQTQLSSRLSQLEDLDLQPINKDIAVQRRLIKSLQNQCASLENSLNKVIENLNNSSLQTKVNDLEKGLAQISAAIGVIQNRLKQEIQPSVDRSDRFSAIQVSEPQPIENLDQSPPTAPAAPPSLPVEVPLPSVQPQNWRCIHTLTGHSDWVRSLAISPDGKILASGSFDKTIKLWHLPDGQLINTLSDHSKGVFAVAITPDGQTLASSSWDETIKLWHLDTGKLIYTLTDHSGSVRSLAIAPDGQTLISGSFDQTIKLWSLAKGELIGTLTENAGQVYAIALSPNGQTLASGGDDGIVTLWALDTGKKLGVLAGNSTDGIYRTSTVCSLTISSDGQILACGRADGTIKLWYLSTLEMMGVLTGHSGQVMSVVISPDSQTLISGSADGTIKLWHLGTGQQLCTLSENSSASVISVALSPQGKMLASGSVDGTIKVWRQD